MKMFEMITRNDVDMLDYAYRHYADNLKELTKVFLDKLKLHIVRYRYRDRNLFQLVGYVCRGIPWSTHRDTSKEHFRTYRELVAGVLEHSRNLLDMRMCPWVVRSGQFVKTLSITNFQLTRSVDQACILPELHANFLASHFKIQLYPFVCADCGASLMLRYVPAWGKHSFLCEHYPKCQGLCSVHLDHCPLGFPVDQKTRRARRLTHNIFDSIWSQAHLEYGNDGLKTPKRFQQIGRHRCYAYIAHLMGIPVKECHIAQFNIQELRIFYRHCQNLTYPLVREWYKSQKATQRNKEQNASQNVDSLLFESLCT